MTEATVVPTEGIPSNISLLPQESLPRKDLNKDSKRSKNKETKKEKIKTVPYFKLFRFATRFDIFLVIVGCLASLGHGAMTPLFTILFGNIIDEFKTQNPDLLLSQVKDIAVWFLIFGSIAGVCSYLQVGCLLTSAQNQAHRMRQNYISSLLRQDMSWYDDIDSGELATRVTSDVADVEQGIADKLGSFLHYSSLSLVGFIIGFVKGWKLTLIILAASPLLVIAAGAMAHVLSRASSEGNKAYAKADGVANEVFSMFRTVVAFSGEEYEVNRYRAELQGSYKSGRKSAIATGLGLGITMSIVIMAYALGFWVGYTFVQKNEMSTGSVLTVFFSVIIGAMAIGNASPNITAMAKAQGAAYFIFDVIGREPKIDNFSNAGKVPEKPCKGDLAFNNVHFQYKENGKKVLENMTFEVKSGETIALIGESGCGKSTIVSLVERFYSPTAGDILLDGVKIDELNIQWLRSQIGYVSQMPTLFEGTVEYNISLGAGFILNEAYDPSRSGGLNNPRFRRQEVTIDMIVEAAKKANAHSFISTLPNGYKTYIGPRGTQLSGGQKQRIAIARALVRDPRVLLFDEATSALDSESERVVQEALDKASEGRTTIVIAHRLSTIRHATKIAVVVNGAISELGSHSELLQNPQSLYSKMLELQKLKESELSGSSDLSKESFYSPVLLEQDQQLDELPEDAEVPLGHTLSAKEKVIQKAKRLGPGVYLRAFKLNKPDWPFLCIGYLGAMCSGVIWPVFSIAFSEMIDSFTLNNKDQVEKWVLVFVGLGLAAFLANFMNHFGVGIAGERLTNRVRIACFEKLVRQPVYWFDSQEHSVGIIKTRLSSDATRVRNLVGDCFSIFLTEMATLTSGIVIAFTACPKLSAVVLACVPVIMLGAVLQMKLMSGFLENGAKVYAEAGKLANEAVDNIRTVASLSVGYHFLERYTEKLNQPASDNRKKTQVAAISFAFTEFSTFAIWALSFWYGTRLVTEGHCQFKEMMKSITSIVFGALTLGRVSAMLPDMATGKVSAAHIYHYLDLKSELDITDEKGEKPAACSGNISFSRTHFKYPTRPNVKVLKGLSTSVSSGKTLALVGESGCGKSTLVGLLERFYCQEKGEIFLDEINIEDYNLKWLRSMIGIVSQEPELFQKSVRENIAYGFSKLDTTVVTDEQIVKAAKKANAHDFIMKLPEGYDTNVGERGSLLSGGQRQRVAIARALVRDPKILLLDEATSALDSESERIVQEALDQAREGRTTIVVAHRLTTIEPADKICVIANGKVAESGKHGELKRLKGIYAKMVEAQNR
ncbi:ATP-dependent translocase ABCB1-like isoform X1 [Zophobas morio]|uniref:ATP-dependent translocase ABCB1-like isoform X1 n=1 Tax=Zophobas morio TaxID=2755281 RepID=UPI0030827639